MAADRARRHLVIIARRPAYGVGKRRLAAEGGDLLALRFQRFAFAALMRRLGRDPRWTTWAGISPDRPSAWAAPARTLPQGRGDLGRRMGRVVRALPPGPAVLIGTDTPAVAAADIAQAFRSLGAADAVFGPALDGGYWLIGLSRRTGRLPFAGVRWSTAHAMADTAANLRGRRVRVLRALEDVDDLAAYRRVTANKCSRPPEGPGPPRL